MTSVLNRRGFTLVEMVVAIAIFAIISVAIYGTVARFMETQTDLQQRSDDLARINTLFTLMERDTHNGLNRPARGAYGDVLPAFQSSTAGQDEIVLFDMTMATPSYQQLDEAELTRAGWLFKDGQIIRQSWRVLDRAQDSEPDNEVLMDNVESVEVGYYVEKNKRYVIENSWNAGTPPPGIVVTISLVDGPSYKRVFDFAGD